MVAPSVTLHDLRYCDGFRVDSPEGLIGWVEEVWLGAGDEPRALAVRTIDGRRGLLSADHVAAVVPEHEWVVVSSRPVLLELDAPRLQGIDANVDSPAVASWGTTGAALPPPPAPGTVRRAALGFRSRHPPRTRPPAAKAERPIWQMVALLYSGLALLVALLITATFVVSYLVTGRAY